MTATTVRTEAVTQHRRGLGPNATLALLASLVVSLLASSSAPTPLYAMYAQHWNLQPVTITIVFGVYALAVLVALLTFGRLSDHVGRKPILVAALALSIVSMSVFATASGLPELLTGRVLQGLATGAAWGALGAAMIDIHNSRGTFANAVMPGIGTATGAIVSSLVVQFLPAPTHLIYLILIVCYTGQLALLTGISDTVSRMPGAWASLRPEFALPPAARQPAVIAAPVLFAVWALAGFYGSLGPALIRAMTGSTSAVVSALPLFVLAAAAVVATIVLRSIAGRTMFAIGIVSLIAGLAITLIATGTNSVMWFFVGSVVAGVGFGSGFQGGVRTVVPHARPHERAGVVSVLYSVCYLGFGGPAVIAGWLVAHQSGPAVVAREYGLALIALAALAGLGMLRRQERAATPAAQ